MQRNIRGVSFAANMAGGLSVFGLLTFLNPATSVNDRDTQISMVVFAVASIVFVPFAALVGYRVGAPVRRWLCEERPPTPAERRATLRQPLRQAALSACAWGGAMAIFVPLQFVFDNPPIEAVRVAYGITLGGLVTCLLV